MCNIYLEINVSDTSHPVMFINVYSNGVKSVLCNLFYVPSQREGLQAVIKEGDNHQGQHILC